MKKTLKLSTFQIGSPRKRGQGLRISTTRRPPRGVPKSRRKRYGKFDVWLPSLSPSEKLIRRFKCRDWENPSVRRAFFDSYERELLSTAVGRQNVEFVALVAKQIRASIGCYCDDELFCHRSRLFKIIKRFA